MIRIAYSEIYQHPLPEGHRFPMAKYELIPKQLLREGIATEKNFFTPGKAAEDVLRLTHDDTYIYELKNCLLDEKHIRRIGFPLNEALVERELTLVQGSIDCAVYALQNGVALNVAGGTHHAFSNRGEGFCLLNDQAVAASFLLHKRLAKKILIADLDVHQGNGTAQIFAGHPQVFTFSMHGKDNYPLHKERSYLDIELENGTGDDAYLLRLNQALLHLIKEIGPDFVFYNAGVDVLATDRYGKLQLSQEGCRQRDETLFSICSGNGIPVAVSMGGGYSPGLADIVNAHCNTFKAAFEIWD